MTAPGSPPLTSVWSWDWAGNSPWFGDKKLPKILPALSQKDPKWIMATFTIGTWLKIWPSKAGSAGQKAKWVNISLCPVTGISWLLPTSPDKIFPLQTCQSHDPCDFTHLPRATLINNDDKNNSKGHKAELGLWVIHPLDFECCSSLGPSESGHNSTKNKSQL